MGKKKRGKPDPLAKLFEKLHPTKDEIAKVEAAAKDPDEFIRLVRKLDNKYKVRSLEAIGVDQKLINAEASRPASAEMKQSYRVPAQSGFAMAGELLTTKKLACDCVVPFKFQGLDVYNNMSGPEQNEVARGVIGASRYGPNEYTVWNPGTSSGTYRAHIYGQMHISFGAKIPKKGRWCLIHPSGLLFINGHTRVVGHGNWSTCYDAKVWIDYFQVLEVGGNPVEISGGEIHYDGTRSDDRTKYFDADRYLPPRYVFFDVPHDGDDLLLTLRIEVDTAANSDGLATGVIDTFGFPANVSFDYDTFVIKAP
jgi:hypothetical protein